MNITELVANAHAAALNAGWWDDQKKVEAIIEQHAPDMLETVQAAFYAQKLMLIVSEIGEAMESHRNKGFGDQSIETYKKILKKKGVDFDRDAFKELVKDTPADEKADAVIREADLSGWQDIDLEWHIRQKMMYNATRGRKHGKNY